MIVSFTYRRRSKDTLQAAVFLVMAVIAIGIGYRHGASAAFILLGYLPFAMCVAMLASIFGHTCFRQCHSGTIKREDLEKSQL